MGQSKESLAKKNVFAQKYDEIRRLDGNEHTFKGNSNVCLDFHQVFYCLALFY
jgi:hypothetical protein